MLRWHSYAYSPERGQKSTEKEGEGREAESRWKGERDNLLPNYIIKVQHIITTTTYYLGVGTTDKSVYVSAVEAGVTISINLSNLFESAVSFFISTSALCFSSHCTILCMYGSCGAEEASTLNWLSKMPILRVRQPVRLLFDQFNCWKCNPLSNG